MPRRTFSEDVTWVNKTSANFRTRSRHEAHSINSHINGSYARWKRQENARRVKSQLLSLSHNPDEPVERRRRASLMTHPRKNEKSPDKHLRQGNVLSDTASSQPSSSTVSSVTVSPPRDTGLTPSPGQIANPHSVLCRGNSDPFNSTIVPITALNAHCHRLAREFQVGSIWAEEMSQDELRSATINWWLADSTTIKFRAAMHGLLAWAYSSRLSVQAYPPQQVTLMALEYKTAALRELQQLVTALTSFDHHYAAYEAMLFLAATEWSARNAAAVMAHMKSAHAILHTMGGFNVLPDPKKESSLWMFVTLCFHFPVRPLVRPHELDPGPLSAQKTLRGPVIDELKRSSRLAGYRRTAGTTTSLLAGGTLVSLWEAISEARHAVDLIRGSRVLPRALLGALNRWLFLRKLATRSRLEHLWHDLKLLLKNCPIGDAARSDAVASHRHLYLWQVCTCMASRMFDELVFEKLHPGDDVTGHWTPYYLRYLPHLRELEEEEAKCHSAGWQRDASVHEECQTMWLWLYFMGAAVEELVFHSSRGRLLPQSEGLKQDLSCSQRFRKLYESHERLQEGSIAATFEENLLFAPNIMQRVLATMVQETTDSG